MSVCNTLTPAVLELPVEQRWITVPAAVGDVRVRIVWPPHNEPLPVIVYLPDAAAGTDDQLVGELAVGAEAAVAVVEYDRYPVAIEQGYATARWLTREGGSWGLDPTRMAVAGDEQLASVLRGALNDA